MLITELSFLFQVDGNWGEWTTWSSCSVSCGGGVRRRERKCDNPPPVGDGFFCQGVATEEDSCRQGICPGMQLNLSYIFEYNQLMNLEHT